MLEQIRIIDDLERDIQVKLLLLLDKAKTRKKRRAVEAAQRALTKWHDVHVTQLGKVF